MNALMCAASGDKTDEKIIDTAKLLLDSGADINAVDKHDRSALMIAVNTGNYKLTEYLIGAGANIQQKDEVSR